MANIDIATKIERKNFIVKRLSENPLFVDWMKLKYVIETGQQIEKMIEYESHFLRQLEKQKIDFDKINAKKDTLSQYDNEIDRQRQMMQLEREKRDIYKQYNQEGKDYDDQQEYADDLSNDAGSNANVDEYHPDNMGMMGTDALEPKPKNLQYAGRDKRELMMQQPKIHNPYAQQHEEELQAQQQAVQNLRQRQAMPMQQPQQMQGQPQQPMRQMPPQMQGQRQAMPQQQRQPMQGQPMQRQPQQPQQGYPQQGQPIDGVPFQPAEDDYDQTDYGDMTPEQKAQRIVESTGNEIDNELANDEDISFDGLPEFEDDK